MKGLFKQSEISTLVAIGIGAALFYVLGRFVAIPVFFVPNTTLNLQYGLLAVFALLYGPMCAFLVGIIGHILIDVTGYGLWLSWEITSGIVGLIIGILCLRILAHKGEFARPQIIRFNVAIVVANAIGFMLVAPVLDIVIYSEPASKVFLQGVSATIMNAITACILGTLLTVAYVKARPQKGSLRAQ